MKWDFSEEEPMFQAKYSCIGMHVSVQYVMVYNSGSRQAFELKLAYADPPMVCCRLAKYGH